MAETLETLNHVYGCDGKLLVTGLHVWHRELGTDIPYLIHQCITF